MILDNRAYKYIVYISIVSNNIILLVLASMTFNLKPLSLIGAAMLTNIVLVYCFDKFIQSKEVLYEAKQ